MERLLLPLVVMVSLVGCATLDKAKLSDPSIRQPLDPLTLDIGCDVYLIRADLNRGMHTETRQVTQTGAGGMTYTTTQTVSVPNAYHYVGVDLGNGIIFDFNHNLCLDLVRFYGLAEAKAFTITRQSRGLFSAAATFEKAGNKFIQTIQGLLGGKRTVELGSSTIDIVEPGFLGSKPRITIRESSIDYDPAGFLGLGAITITRPDPQTVEFPEFWAKAVFKKPDDTHITLDTALEITHRGDTIELQFNGLFGWNTKYTFFKTAEGCFFYNNETLQGVEIRKENDQINVFLNGTAVETYMIEVDSGQGGL